MKKATLLENLAAVKVHADQSKINAEAQKVVIAAFIAMGRDPAAAERILHNLEAVQDTALSELERILNELDGKA